MGAQLKSVNFCDFRLNDGAFHFLPVGSPELSISNSGEGFETKFLTLAAELCEDTKWQKLVKELETVDSDSPAQLESADNRD